MVQRNKVGNFVFIICIELLGENTKVEQYLRIRCRNACRSKMIDMFGCSAYFSAEEMTALRLGGAGHAAVNSSAGRKARSDLLYMKTGGRQRS